MAPVLVPLRPSSEHILIVRALGARDQHGVSFHPFLSLGLCEQGGHLTAPFSPPSSPISLHEGGLVDPQLRASLLSFMKRASWSEFRCSRGTCERSAIWSSKFWVRSSNNLELRTSNPRMSRLASLRFTNDEMREVSW